MTTFKSSERAKSMDYPEPLVMSPILTHKQTIIILHGRGSDARVFGPPLLSTKLPDGRNFQTALPHVKFIFPTASKRRAQAYNRSIIHQWFDYASFSAPTEKEELMIDGLRESSNFIHGLLTEAIKEVGAGNVALGGLSQGCAATLISLLTWEGETLGAAFGMCGWLPLRQHIADFVDPRPPSEDGEDPFAREEDKVEGKTLPAQAIAWLREELDFPIEESPSGSTLLPFQRTPLFLAHGTDDDKVRVELGREAKDCLAKLRAEVEWREYGGLGHWYSGPMLGDSVDFLEKKAGWIGKLETSAEKTVSKEERNNTGNRVETAE